LRFAHEHLWKRQFDLGLLPRWDADPYHASLLTYMSRATWRVAYSEEISPHKKWLNRGCDGLFTRTLKDLETKHEVQRNLDFLRAAGGVATDDSLELWLSEEDRGAAKEILRLNGIDSEELLMAIAPGAGHAKRQWSLERFIQVARVLIQEFGTKVVIVGGEQDRDAAARLAEGLGKWGINLAGKLTIRETSAVLERTRIVISNDSGPMHLAAAAGVPVVEISCHPLTGDPLHPNSPKRFRPWLKEHSVLQPEKPRDPCNLSCEWHEAHCILGISVGEVLGAARIVLSRKKDAAPQASGTQVGD